MRRWAWLAIGGLSSGVLGWVAGCGGADDPGRDGGGGVITGVGVTSGSGGAQMSATVAQSSTSVGAGGSGGSAPPCSDDVASEPNNSIGTAWKMSDTWLDDCDTDSDPVIAMGTIAGEGDVDWYWYEGDDGLGFCVDPGRSLVQSESGIRICKYLECKAGQEQFECPEGTSVAQVDGRDGCCAMGDFQLADLKCTGTLDDAANVYIRIDQPGADAHTCNAYTLSVDF